MQGLLGLLSVMDIMISNRKINRTVTNQIQRKIFTVKLSMVIGRTEGVLPVLLHTKTRREHSQSSSDLSPFSSHRVPKKSTHNSFNLSGQRFCAAAAVAAALHYKKGEVHQSCFNPLLMKKDRVCLYVIAFFPIV